MFRAAFHDHALARLVRALFAGGAATIVDIGVLALLVSGAGFAPRVANAPALLVGGTVAFFANRHWVFRAARGSLSLQAALYVVVEVVSLGLNGVLFDALMRTPLLREHSSWYVPARLVSSHLVFLLWSYPLWRFVFRVQRDRHPRAETP